LYIFIFFLKRSTSFDYYRLFYLLVPYDSSPPSTRKRYMYPAVIHICRFSSCANHFSLLVMTRGLFAITKCQGTSKVELPAQFARIISEFSPSRRIHD